MRTHCVAICQLSNQPQEDFDVNTELLILDARTYTSPPGMRNRATVASTSTS